MSTVGRGDQRRRRSGSPAERPRRDLGEASLEASLEETLDESPRSRRRWLRFWLWLGFGVGALFALPMLAGTLGMHNYFLARAAGINGSIRAQSASLGWFSPVVLRDVEVRDADGAAVAKIDALAGEKSLFGFAFGGRDLGRFTVTHPVVRIVIDDGGSNIEELLRPLLERPSTGAAPIVGVTVDDGVVLIEDAAARRKYEINDLQLALQAGGAQTPLKLKSSGQLRHDAQPASFDVELETQPGDRLLAAGDAQWNIDGLPLESLQPLVRRYVAGAETAGSLSMNGRYVWGLGEPSGADALDEEIGSERRRRSDANDAEGPDTGRRTGARGGESEFRGRCEIHDLSFQADLLRGDRLELERLSIPCQLIRRGEWVDIEKLAIDSDLGELTISGRAPLSSLGAEDIAAALAGESLQIEGKLDLARAARMLPNSLRVREGTEIVGGDLEIALRSQPDREGVAVDGRLEATNLAARTNGRRVSWREPLVATIKARQTADGPVIDQLKCSSSFLQIVGEGTPDDLDATAQFDLAVLMDELAKFVDLGGVDLAGVGDVELHLKRAARGGFAATVDFQARDFQWISDGRRPWREPQLAVRLDAAGTLERGALRDLERASLNVDAGAEQLNLQLAEPLENLNTARLPLELAWKGQLAEWLPRIESWLPLAGWDVAGVGTATASVVWSRQRLDIKQANVQLRNFRALGEGWNIDEPSVELAIAGAVDSAQGSLVIEQGDLTARDLKLRADKVRLANSRQTGAMADGKIAFRAELAQLASWRQRPRAAARVELSGLAVGSADVDYSRGLTHAQITTTITNLALADAAAESPRPRRPRATLPQTAWQERKLDLVAKASYDSEQQRLQVERVELAGDAVRAAVAGSVDASGRQTDLDLAGRLEFDWQRLAPLWRQYLPREFEIEGRESREFRLHGPWRSDAPSLAAALAELQAEGGLGWSSASIYGLPIGETSLVARLDRGRVQIQPLDVAVSGGRITLAPSIKLSPEPAELQFPAGRTVDRVQLTPEICRRGLKFVAPVLAEVTVADGEFSVDVDGARFPLADPVAGEAVGAVALSARVRPGPIVEQLVLLVREVEHLAKGDLNPPSPRDAALMVMNDERIEFKMIDRRIYHQSLQFRVGSTDIVTRGSVGLDDESLAILAQVKLSPQVTIDVPIQGTLTDFQLDRRALGRVLGKSVEGAVRGLLLDQLDKGLDKLLPPNK